MKNSKFLKLISLALTVALLVAVAVPTLTTSAEDTTPAYVTDLTVDFEDEADSAFGTIVTDETTGNKYWQIPVATVGVRKFKNVLLKAGHTYWFSFDYYITVNTSSDSVAWFKPCYADGTQYGPTYASTAGEWKNFTGYFTPTTDTTFSIVTDDGVGIDDFRIIDFSNSVSGKTAVYFADDGVADLENEVLIYPESHYRTVTYTYDSGIGKNIASFRLTKTDQHLGLMVPFQFKAGKKYSIKFNYYSDGNSVAANPYSFRVQAGSDLDASDAKNKTIGWVGVDTPAWTTASLSFSPTADYFGLHFDAHRTDNCYIDVKIHSLSIVEQSTENTATKQTYTFDTHSMPIKSSVYAGVVAVEKNGYMTSVVELNGTNAANKNPEIYMDLDFDLTIDKWYKISYDYKGKGALRIVPNNGKWNGEMYSIEAFNNKSTGNSINTNGEWHHNEAVFKAEHASSHVLFLMDHNGEKLYIDNFVVEEYTPVESFTMDFENNDYGYNNYSIATDPLDATGQNRVLKCNNSSAYSAFFVPTMRLQKDHVYEISFKHYGGTWFRCDVRTSTGGESRNFGNDPSKTQWKTASHCIKVSENEDMGMIAIFCESTTYFDDFVIRDVTNTSIDSDKLDFSSETGILINHTGDTSVTKEQRETIVTKLTFNQSCNTDNGKVSLPFFLEGGKTYVVNMTYKSDVWVAMQWAEKVDSYEDRVSALNSNPLNVTSKWTTVTRYVTGKGTEFDTIHFYSGPGGGDLYIADVTITEATEAGGLNGDGVIDTTDYTLMRNRFFSAKRDDSKQFEKYADQNSDGTVDILDMVRLSLKSANNYQ